MQSAFDPEAERTLFVSGQHGMTQPSLDAEVFAWNGSSWETIDASSPPAGGGGIMARHDQTETFVVFGASGNADQTYLWDGVSAWDVASVTAEPSARVDTAGGYDPAGFIWMFGGRLDDQLGDLWRFDGDGWELVIPEGTVPSPRSSLGAAWDVARGELVVFGGITSSGGPIAVDPATYLFDGTSFRVAPAGDDPEPRYGAALSYDPLRERVILYGGNNVSNSPRAGLWEWNGAAWRAIQLVAGSPEAPPSYGSSFVFDAARARHVYVPWTYDVEVPPLPAAPPTWELVMLGNACTDATECGTGFCVDHVCCIEECGAGAACNVLGSAGTCVASR